MNPSNHDETIFALASGVQAELSSVGGKAYNLIQMQNAALRVPPGFVLATTFFAPWFEALQALDAWQTLMDASGETEVLREACDALKETSKTFVFSGAQTEQLAPFWDAYAEDDLFAVRSSSPEEDLEGSSFAGIYETVLGVSRESFPEAVKTAFASCLDYRIASYKKEKGFTSLQPRIAVVVQKQIASEVSGVGFSINPINNCYDEAIFTANWGLGETVVSGLVNPDCVTVDKHTQEILSRTLGEKETALWLLPGGGTEERRDERHDSFCLEDAQIAELTTQLNRIEAYYKAPMDIEWAYEDGTLYLLQARPITTHHPLAQDMLTRPGAPKRLYLDVTISVQGLTEPLSPLGGEVFSQIVIAVNHEMLGRDFSDDLDDALVFSREGRIYFQASNILHALGDRFIALIGQMDTLSSKALEALAPGEFPGRWHKLQLLSWLLPRMRPRVRNILRAHRDPVGYLAWWHQRWEEIKQTLAKCGVYTPAPSDYIRNILSVVLPFVARETVPMFISAKIAMARIRKLFPTPTPEIQTLLDTLDLSLPGNVTIDMGHALYALSRKIPADACDPEALTLGVQERTLPDDFLQTWDAFLAKYGHRANREIDAASPRFWEQPHTLMQQICSFAQLAPKDSPVVHFAQAQNQRRQARDTLAALLEHSPRKHKRFLKLHHLVETLGGQRETHKYVAVYAFDLIRRQLLRDGKSLQDAGRIDDAEDVFFLPLASLEEALGEPSVDVRALVSVGKQVAARGRQCKQVVPLVDSRGRFYSPPPRPVKPGEVAGQGVSVGVVTGPIKVLHSPDEKPLLPGDILVARATDPAWTPLFVNAAGIILEVGGPLQHGALVAREYGKPCIAGVSNATSRFADGEIVEMDGTSGIIRKIDSPS